MSDSPKRTSSNDELDQPTSPEDLAPTLPENAEDVIDILAPSSQSPEDEALSPSSQLSDDSFYPIAIPSDHDLSELPANTDDVYPEPPLPTHVMAPPPPPTELPPQSQQRRSVTWSQASSDSGSGSGSKDASSLGPGHVRRFPRAHRSIPKIRRSNMSRIQSNSWIKQKLSWFLCCGSSYNTGVAESDSEDEVYDDFTPKKMKMMDEEELCSRLQQAIHELRQPPTRYDIEAEIQKWHMTLEIEQMMYEESGKPKFKYKWFRKNQYLAPKKHPLYGTNYENQRKLEVRLEEFRFGASTAINDFGVKPEVKYKHGNSYESKDSTYWRSDAQVLYANLALLCSASNFMRFPQACYANGGFTFLLTYCLMIATVGQPLLYFEMVLGQLSLHGPSGFSRLHPFAKGLPYAVAFVCVVFGTTRSIYLAYSILYSLISIVASPAMCGWWYSGGTKCVPYDSFEMYERLLKAERAKATLGDNDTLPVEEVHIFSVELFFREVMLDADWRSGDVDNYIHWKLVLAYILVCCIALVPVHYNLAGKNMKRFLRNSSRFIPAMLTIMFLHQIFARGAMSLATQYFLTVDSKHVSALSLWSEAFEMVLSTLGIGYGFHWSISGNISIDYRDTYKMSWRICGLAVLFGLLSSLVLFCEIGIVGEFTGVDSHYSVFYERLGISFVCFSGALYKLGSNTVVLIFLFFLLFVFYGMWSQIIVADIILRWIERGHIIRGPTHAIIHRKRSTLVVLIVFLLFVMSPYFFSTGGSVFASENIFGGALAAYLVVLAELVIAGYLYGFANFFADMEIIIKRPSPTLFQVQMRYVVIPTIVIFMLPMILNVYLYPSIYHDRNKLGWLFYFGLAANFAPIAILVLSLPFDIPYPSTIKRSNKVIPVPESFFQNLQPTSNKTSTMDELRERYPLIEPKFVAKVNAPSQQSHGLTIRSEIYQTVEHNMEFCHSCQDFVKSRFMKLLRFKINQRRWLKLVLGVVMPASGGGIKFKSMPELVFWIMLAQKCRNDRIDIGFLTQALEQIVNLTFSTAIRKLQRMPMQEMLLYMADELLKLTIYRPEDHGTPHNLLPISSSESSSSSPSEDENATIHNKINHKKLILSSSDSTEDERPHNNYLEIYRRLIGQTQRTPEEMRTLLIIRIKRGLGLPIEGELGVLRFLRRQRARLEREMSCWSQTDKPPIDHFIPSSISNKNKEKICFTIFHAVVVEGNDHYALKRLPVPRPPIVRVTKRFVQSQPGIKLSDKFAHIVTKRMHRNIGRIVQKRNLQDLSKKKLKRHLWKVSDRVDDDVYDFLDRILTCVIVIVPDSDPKKKLKRTMYLTPRTKRRTVKNPEGSRRRGLTDHEIQSYAALNLHQRRHKYWDNLLDEMRPTDIRYHSDSSDSEVSVGSSDSDFLMDVKSSSGSSSTLSPDDTGEEDLPNSDKISMDSQPLSRLATRMHAQQTPHEQPAVRQKSQYLLQNETLQSRDIRMLHKKSGFGVMGLEEKETDLEAVRLSLEKIKHISARRWKHERDVKDREENEQIEAAEEEEKGRKPGMKVKFTEKELKLQKNVDAQASRVALEAIASKSMEMLKSAKSRHEQQKERKGGLRKAVSLESIRHLLESQAEFKVDLSKGQIVAISKDRMDSTRIEGKLMNVTPELLYITYGKTLIVDHGVKMSSIHLSKRRQRLNTPQSQSSASSKA